MYPSRRGNSLRVQCSLAVGKEGGNHCSEQGSRLTWAALLCVVLVLSCCSLPSASAHCLERPLLPGSPAQKSATGMQYFTGTSPEARMLLASGVFQASYLLGLMNLQANTAHADPVTAYVSSGHDAYPQSQWETATSSRDPSGTLSRGET